MSNEAALVSEDIQRLSSLSANDAPPGRMVQATLAVVLRWQAAAPDAAELQTWLEDLWRMLNDGVLAHEEAAGNLDLADTRSGPVVERRLGGLRDSRTLVTAALERL